MISISEAWDHIESNVGPQPIHNVNLLSATGHILADDVIADVEATPTWSPQYQKAEILESYDNGRPKRVKMTVKAAGLTDEGESSQSEPAVTPEAGLSSPKPSPSASVMQSTLESMPAAPG